MDLVVKGGTVITATETMRADVGVKDGKVVQLAENIDSKCAKEVVDASGKYVIPGVIDAHTHLQMPSGDSFSVDDYLTGTTSGAAGGVTCIVDFATQPVGGYMREALDTWKGRAEGNAIIDYGFHITITDARPDALEEIKGLVDDGITTFKMFMAFPGTLMVDDATLFSALKVMNEYGAMGAVHAENGYIIDVLQKEAYEQGNLTPIYHALTRPSLAEGEAARRAISIAKMAGASLLIVHNSTKEAVEAIRDARLSGQVVYGETCPQYLGVIHQDKYEEPNSGGVKYIFSPPLRTKEHSEAIWNALRLGYLQDVSSDHCTFEFNGRKLENKDDFRKVVNGGPGIEAILGIVHNEGVNKGRISLNQMVALVSTNAAKIHGLYPQKGTIAVGGDADIVIFDPNKDVVISQSNMHHACDYTIFEGHEVKGWPVMTISRGEVICKDGKVTAKPGRGKFVARKPIDNNLLLA